MNENIRRVLSDIARLEEELASLLHEQQEQLHYRIEGSKIRFERNLRRIHRELKTGVVAWLLSSEVRNVLTAPFIYAMVFPIALLDLFLFVYQSICFPLYRIPRVKRSNYIVLDRHNLGYLNAIEKINCLFCGYADGVFAYARQVLSRTETYWCPIKHARRVLDPHRQYARFADFGAGEGYEAHVGDMRRYVRGETPGESKPPDQPAQG
jgi:hypothetical protein